MRPKTVLMNINILRSDHLEHCNYMDNLKGGLDEIQACQYIYYLNDTRLRIYTHNKLL